MTSDDLMPAKLVLTITTAGPFCSLFFRCGPASGGLTVPNKLRILTTACDRAPPTRGKGKNPTCFDSHSVLLHLLSACISGSQALLKGDRYDRIKASRSSLPGITSQAGKETGARHQGRRCRRHRPGTRPASSSPASVV